MASVLSSGKDDLNEHWKLFLKQTQGDDDDAAFSHVAATAGPKATPEGFTFKAKKPLGATYDSRVNALAFGQAEDVVGDDGSGLLLALSEPPKGIKLDDLVSLFGLPDNRRRDQALKIVDLLFDAIGGQVPLKIDLSQCNGAWFLPAGPPNSTAVRPFAADGELPVYLQFATSSTFKLDGTALKNALGKIIIALNDSFSLALKAPTTIPDDIFSFTFTQILNGTLVSADEFHIETSFRVLFAIKLNGFVVRVQYSPSGVQLGLQEEKIDRTAAAGQESFWNKLPNIFSGGSDGDAPVQQSLDILRNSPLEGMQIRLWNVVLSKDLGGESSKVAFSIAFAIRWIVNEVPIWILLSYSSRDGSFSGGFLFRNMIPSEDEKLLPSYSPMDVPDISPDSFDTGLDLSKVIPEMASMPKNIPLVIREGSIFLIMGEKPMSMGVSVMLTTEWNDQEEDVDPDEVPAPFEWNAVSFRFVKTGTAITMGAAAAFRLNPLPEDSLKYGPADLAVALAFDKGSWTIRGECSTLQFGVLAGYADPGNASALMEIVGKLSIRNLSVEYTVRRRLASSFLMMGTIQLGKLELRLVYQYASHIAFEEGASTAATNNPKALGPVKPLQKPSSTTWSFEAYLGADAESDLGSIAESLIEGAAEDLPPFVRNIKIGAAASPDTSPITLKVSSTTASSGKKTLLFSLRVLVGTVDLTFIQISDNGNRTATPPILPKAKRLLRVSVGKLPFVQDIPVVQELPQPFDKLQYVWVSASGQEWTAADVDLANQQLGTAAQLYYKKTNKPGQDTKPPAGAPTVSAPTLPPALAVGHHFIVVQDNAVVLDHVFGRPKAKKDGDNKSGDGDSSGGKSGGSSGEDADKDDKGKQVVPVEQDATKGNLRKQTKFLSIDAVSLQYKDERLWINLDATVTLGPIQMALLGFGIGIPLSLPGKELTLDSLTDPDILEALLKDIAEHIRIKGMGVSFSKPPLLLSGVFEHEKTQTMETYRGGIGISFPPYTFVAVGAYSKVTLQGRDYKSVFVFAKLDGPLVTIYFATISGVRLAFGYNSVIRSPAVEELYQFPLISDGGIDGAGNNPITVLRQFCGTAENPGFVQPQEDALFFALGMTISAFDLLSITAAVVVSFRDAGIVLSLYANAVARLPPGVTEQEALILYVEINMVAEMNFIDQYFRCEAALAPTSFLLVPQCHLYGGFALCYWFGSNPHAGDWVFSIGGYHRAFEVPAHYPRPRRLGISFTIGDNIMVSGEGYFAITPKAVMGGAAIHISLSVGPVEAYLDAAFDALINFHPIHYQADMRIAVGVSCTIDIWFIHIRIHISIGADLHIEGPEFGGVAHVDFWFFGFDVYFGSHGQLPDPLPLNEFWDLVHKAGPQGLTEDAESKEPATVDVNLKHMLETGNFPMPAKPEPKADASSGTVATKDPPNNTGAGAKWFVKGGSFRFRISADFVIQQAFIASQNSENARISNDKTVSAKYLDAAVKVTAKQSVDGIYSTPMKIGNDKGPITSYLEIVIKTKDGKIVENWKPEIVVEKVPSALWAPYSASTDPMVNRRSDNPILKASGGTLNLCTGISIKAPPPILAPKKIPAFNATEFQKFKITKPDASDWIVPVVDSDDANQPATIPPAPLDTKQEAKPAETRWADMKLIWGTTAKMTQSTSSSMASLCASVLGWDAPPPEVEAKQPATGPKTWQLRTALPQRLVVGTKAGSVVNADVVDGLQNFYLALPRVAAAA